MTATWKRLSIAIALVLSGLALLPYIALPSEQLSWQRFAGVYGAAPGLISSYSSGAPGSAFTITGYNFRPGAIVAVSVNGRGIGSVTTDPMGGFSLDLSTDNASLGSYTVVAAGPAPQQAAEVRVSAGFRLSAAAPLRGSMGGAITYALGPGVAAPSPANGVVFLPLTRR